jgi:hypothetical protein
MKIKRAVITGVHPYAFRSGESAFIIGAAMVTPENNLPERLCYQVIFDDGQTDYVPVSCLVDGSYRVEAEPDSGKRESRKDRRITCSLGLNSREDCRDTPCESCTGSEASEP